MNNKGYINSAVLVAELIQDYNIQSNDFITRFPNWVVQCLGDLNIRQAYVEKYAELAIEGSKTKLPDFYRSIIAVYINNRKATPKNPYDEAVLKKDDNNIIFTTVKTPYFNSLGNIEFPLTISSSNNKTEDELDSKESVEYYINQGWLHTPNLDSGIAKIYYLAIPVIYDGNLNMNFPLIYNDEILKEAIKLFILKRMLNRGYVHPIQNLSTNNPYTNPALRYDQIRYRVRTSVNKFSVIDREVISNILNQQSISL